MNSMEDDVRAYLTTLRAELKGLPDANRDEIVSEIGVHLRESIAQSGASAQRVIAQLGPAKELAAQYQDNLLIERTAHTYSPWHMLRAVWRLASVSTLGFVCFLLAVAGYGGGVAMVITALLKPLFPKQIGLWVGPGVFDFGFHQAGGGGGIGLLGLSSAPANEVLGLLYIPVALTIGGLLMWGTTIVLRKLIKVANIRRPGPLAVARYEGQIISGCFLFAFAALGINILQLFS